MKPLMRHQALGNHLFHMAIMILLRVCWVGLVSTLGTLESNLFGWPPTARRKCWGQTTWSQIPLYFRRWCWTLLEAQNGVF